LLSIQLDRIEGKLSLQTAQQADTWSHILLGNRYYTVTHVFKNMSEELAITIDKDAPITTDVVGR
jgi:hypothetical protein